MATIIEMNEIGMELNECTQEEWDEIAKLEAWTTKRIWEIDEDTRIVEQRSDRNHLSVVGYFINEAENREKLDEARTCVYTAFHILNNPEGG